MCVLHALVFFLLALVCFRCISVFYMYHTHHPSPTHTSPHPTNRANAHRAHHIKVATREDPATARLNETLYHFLPRCILGALHDGVSMEQQRLQATGTPFWSVHNKYGGFMWVLRSVYVGFEERVYVVCVLGCMYWVYSQVYKRRYFLQPQPTMPTITHPPPYHTTTCTPTSTPPKSHPLLPHRLLWWAACPTALGALITALFGTPGLLLYLGQAVTGILMLEVVNYIEHYGLERTRLPNGRCVWEREGGEGRVRVGRGV